MPDLLLELFCEEIPARMQARAEANLSAAISDGLQAAGLAIGEVRSFSGPRRLSVVVSDIPARSQDTVEEKKGPKVGAPEKAIQGFMRGAQLTDISQADIRSDPKKGDFYVVSKRIEGRTTADIIAELVPDIVTGFHWPKSMRTGRGTMRWVRPLQRILCLFDGAIVSFEVDGIASGDMTEGHRVHGRGPYQISGPDDYVAKLSGPGHVCLSRDERRSRIATQAADTCAANGLELIEDAGLLEEVVGLAEWPVVLLGDMEPGFLDLPPEVIQLSMRTHQKYFSVNDVKTGELAAKFVVVANIEASDGGKAIAAGNSRVLSARLEDARFFWDNDKKAGLEAMAPKLERLEFKKELGSMADKVERVATLARELAPSVGADPNLAERAARLAKADLVSEMVYEFPELQGVMGSYYAKEAGEDSAVVTAIAEHYKPQSPSDAVPSGPVSVAVALADKLDTLVGFWAIDEKPTGSKDPFALRRASLGVVRMILEHELRLPIRSVAQTARFEVSGAYADVNELTSFFADRLKQHLRDQGERHDLIDAVFALGEDDLVLIVKRVQALGRFLASDDGANLLAGYKRAANILKAEEKKGWEAGASVNSDLIASGPAAEQALFAAITKTDAEVAPALAEEDFTAAMTALANLRAPLDTFFEAVMVNDDDPAVRSNRLALLDQMRNAVQQVADFGQIEG
ncbi:MAG: glycine--tRNA ligase subunit beta [Pseudomonadota bacterium]